MATMIAASASAAAPSAELLDGKTISGAASSRLAIDGRLYVNFSGCAYLSLSDLPELRSAAERALSSGVPFAQTLHSAYGVIDPCFAGVEAAGADFCGTEASVFFASGYLIGLVALASLEEPLLTLFVDEGAHFSLVDAARISGHSMVRFDHKDANSLADAVKTGLAPGSRPIVMTDGAFATTGAIPPLADYAAILEPFGGRILIDEAHSFGVIGDRGLGAAEYAGVERLAISAGTLSKAFCAQGALFATDSETAWRVKNAPPLRGANAGSPISAAVGAAALRYMQAHPERRTRLSALTRRLRAGLRAQGLEVEESPAPIVAFRTGSRQQMQALQRRLFEDGIFLLLSNYLGAGPDGLLRAAVYADHEEEDVDRLIAAIAAKI